MNRTIGFYLPADTARDVLTELQELTPRSQAVGFLLEQLRAALTLRQDFPPAVSETWNTCPDCGANWKDEIADPAVKHRTRLCEKCLRENALTRLRET